jgi:hypothetical protein
MLEYHSKYFGCTIYKVKQFNKLPWSSYIHGQFIQADTLQGIRRLIRERYWINQHQF